MKACYAYEVKNLSDIPNIGPAMVRDFALLGITKPKDLKGKNPERLYKKLCDFTGKKQDPCVLYTYRAAIDFMNGGKKRGWWEYKG